MMFGVEYVKNKKDKTPFPKIASTIRALCYKKGLLVEIGGYYNNVVRFLPPLITTKNLAEQAMIIFTEANNEAEVLHSSD